MMVICMIVRQPPSGSGKLLELWRTYPAEAFKSAIEQTLHFGLYDLTRLEGMILSFVAGEFFNLKGDD